MPRYAATIDVLGGFSHSYAALIISIPTVTGGSPPVTDYDDSLGTPAVFAVGGHFHRYPDPPANVSVLEYTTTWPLGSAAAVQVSVGNRLRAAHFGGQERTRPTEARR